MTRDRPPRAEAARGEGATPPSAFELTFEIPLPPSLRPRPLTTPRGVLHGSRAFASNTSLTPSSARTERRCPSKSKRPKVCHYLCRTGCPAICHPRLWPFGGAPTEVVTLAARLENSYLGRGDAIKLRCACHGHSSARHRIQGVEVRLVECLRWRTSCHEQRDLKSLVTHPINDFEVEGCDNDEEDSSTSSFRGRNRSFQQLGQRESRSVDKALEESLVSGRNSLTFAVPEFARDTYQGPFIQCWHVVEIRLLLRGSHPGEGGPSQALKVCIGSSPSDGPRTGVAEVAVMPPPASPTSVVVRQDAREWGSVVSGGDGDPSLANACGTTDLKYARTVERPPATGPTGAVSSLPPPLSPLRTASV